MNDHYGRRVNYMRIAVTDRCNLRCRYCMPENGIEKKEHAAILRHEEIVNIVKAGAAVGINKIRLTGGEPLVRRGITQLIEQIAGVEGIEDIGMTTNGTLLERYAEGLKAAGLRRINVSLDTLNPTKYREMTRGGNLSQVLRGLEKAKEVGLAPIKINSVLIGGFNDGEVQDFIRFAAAHDVEWRIIELMPIGEVSSWSKDKFIDGTEFFGRIDGLRKMASKSGGPATVYHHEATGARIGLINPISDKFCGDCNRIRLTADGHLKPCLHSDLEIDIKTVIDDRNRLVKIIESSIENKPGKHDIYGDNFKPVQRDMYRIGG